MVLRLHMAFVEGKLVEEKVFGDTVFPKTLLPSPDCDPVTCDLAELVKSKQAWLSEQLQRHGAILFREFRVPSAEDFARVVEAFGWEEMDCTSASTRIKVTERVFTANEAPIDETINFRHEMSLVKEFPSKIFFFCSKPSPEGGETSIAPSHIVVEKMEEEVPNFVSKLEDVGYIIRVRLPKDITSRAVISTNWKALFKTDNQVEAEKRAKLNLGCSSLNFLDDGSAEMVYGPMNPIKKFGERRVWFNNIVGYTKDENDLDLSFGDGTHFPADAVNAHKKILSDNCVDLRWQKGDVLLVDNLMVQHARRPGKPPGDILLSMCK